jgi:hypothetical protein
MKNATIKSDYKIRLQNNPLRLSGTDLRIAINDTDIFNINDKIILYGLNNITTTIRTIIKDTDGSEIEYVTFNELGYAEIRADTNIFVSGINSNSLFNNINNKIKVTLDGFVGDKKTEYFFDFTGFNYNIEKTGDIYTFKITENVNAISGNTQQPTDMLIGEFKMDKYGDIISMNTDTHIFNACLRWLDNDGTYIKLPQEYISVMNDTISSLDNNKCSNVYDAIEYIQKIQNRI